MPLLPVGRIHDRKEQTYVVLEMRELLTEWGVTLCRMRNSVIRGSGWIPGERKRDKPREKVLKFMLPCRRGNIGNTAIMWVGIPLGGRSRRNG